jgi:3-hydroxyacyl-[acyl-carrier-protein] dehydratase
MKSLLSDNFFSILQNNYDDCTPERLTVNLELNKDHGIYAGHFPGNPVVPGVCLIQIIKECLSQHFCKNLILVKSEEVKFLNIVNPAENPNLELEIKIKHPGDEMVHVTVLITSDDKTFMKFRGSFK